MITIAIDGPSGSGKSTTAKLVSEKLGILHLNTGALYRAVAVYLHENNIDVNDVKAIKKALKFINITVNFVNGEQLTILNGEDVTSKLYSSEISKLASTSSSLKSVRSKMLNLQRNIAKEHSVIMEGRDITSHVLPKAKYKFFLSASPDERAKRRLQNLLDAGEKISYEEVLKDINERDKRDTTRKINPLKLVEDATLINNDNYTIDEVVEIIISHIKEH